MIVSTFSFRGQKLFRGLVVRKNHSWAISHDSQHKGIRFRVILLNSFQSKPKRLCLKVILSFVRNKSFEIYVTAAGCGPVIPVSTFVWARISDWPVYASGRYSDLVWDGYRILLLLWVGTHSPHQKVAGLVLSVLLTMELLGIWLTD